MVGVPEVLERFLRENAVADVGVLSTAALIDDLVEHEHALFRDALRLVRALAVKVARVHGRRNPQLDHLADAICELDDALWAHLDDEEATLFDDVKASLLDLPMVRAQLLIMRDEHAALLRHFVRVRESAQEFVAPTWACASYRRLFELLPLLEARVRAHFEREERILLPRFLDLAGA